MKSIKHYWHNLRNRLPTGSVAKNNNWLLIYGISQLLLLVVGLIKILVSPLVPGDTRLDWMLFKVIAGTFAAVVYGYVYTYLLKSHNVKRIRIILWILFIFGLLVFLTPQTPYSVIENFYSSAFTIVLLFQLRSHDKLKTKA